MVQVDSFFDSSWRRLSRAAGFSASWTETNLSFLREEYSASNRHYHSRTHICSMLRWMEHYSDITPVADALQFAAFYHDAIYDTTSAVNEEQSAECAVESLSAEGEKPHLTDEVRRLILCTKNHLVDQHNLERSALFLDCDLMILASNASDYAVYAAQIRQEYSQFDDSAYRAGRLRVLNTFLSRERIFFTEKIRLEHEVRARDNLVREIEQLQLFS